MHRLLTAGSSIGATVVNAVLSTYRTRTNCSAVWRQKSAWNACPAKWLLKRLAQSRNAIHNILGSAKFACRSGVCGWLPTSIRQKTKRSMARLVRKTGRYKLFFNLSSALKKQRYQNDAQIAFLQQSASDYFLSKISSTTYLTVCFVLHPPNSSSKIYYLPVHLVFFTCLVDFWQLV